MSTAKQFNPVNIIRKKRDGQSLTDDEINYLVMEYSRDQIPDYQMSAFLMAAYLNKLDARESTALTESMLHSGKVLDLGDIPGKKIDKHSTGGVGDKLSLILAPIVASYGVPVPMISGRGLGHTGGTLDKLESITGFKVDITLERYKEILAACKMVMAGQTEDIAPADKRLYALRDVTATVEYIPFIASSIMSKKLAEGIDGLVLDVKFGSGAFMKTKEQALKLAETLVSIGENFEKETVAFLSNMNQPLGYSIGNWLEVREALDSLNGEGPSDVMQVTHRLAGAMIYLGGEAETMEEGMEKSRLAVENGQAMDVWRNLVEEQGGDTDLIDRPELYGEAEHQFEVKAEQEGYITGMDAFEIGMASVELGAGRRKKEDSIDPAAGIILSKKIGDHIKKGETIATAFTNKSHDIETAGSSISEAVEIGSEKPGALQMVTHKVDKQGIEELGN